MSYSKQDAVAAISKHFQESAAVKQQMVDTCGEAILEAAELITAAFQSGKKMMLCGNGGSAADCQHLAAEFTSRLSGDFERPGLPALALTCDTSFLTAYANDYDFRGIFARQVQALGSAGDVLIGISTSGNSGNVYDAFAAAQELGIKTIAMTGSGGKMHELADVSIRVPSTYTQYIQEAHLAAEHLMCHIVERQLYGECGRQAA